VGLNLGPDKYAINKHNYNIWLNNNMAEGHSAILCCQVIYSIEIYLVNMLLLQLYVCAYRRTCFTPSHVVSLKPTPNVGLNVGLDGDTYRNKGTKP
jgi:hypothetical protein